VHTLVTGGAGFIGAALVDRLLAEGHSVDVVDNLSTGSLWNLADARSSAGRALTFHQLDVRSPDVAELIVRRRPEVVFHLASHGGAVATSGGSVAEAQVDIVGGLGILDGVRAGGTRKLVVASSAAVYGELSGERPAAESHARRPMSPHGVAKHAVDSYLAVFADLDSVVFTSLVLASVYGPRATTGVITSWAQCLAAGRPCTAFGDGQQVRDFVYVDDVVDALARAAGRGDGMVLNVGTGRATSLVDLHALMVEVAGRVVVELGEGLPPESAEPGPAESEDAPHSTSPVGDTGTEGAADGEEDASRTGDAAQEKSGAERREEDSGGAGGTDSEASASRSAAHRRSPGGAGRAGRGAERGAGPGAAGAMPPAQRRGPALGLRHSEARPGEPRVVVLDPARAGTALDWRAWTALPDGLEAVVRAAMAASGTGRP
jgi:UDP-glucose 4-epimerase